MHKLARRWNVAPQMCRSAFRAHRQKVTQACWSGILLPAACGVCRQHASQCTVRLTLRSATQIEVARDRLAVWPGSKALTVLAEQSAMFYDVMTESMVSQVRFGVCEMPFAGMLIPVRFASQCCIT